MHTEIVFEIIGLAAPFGPRLYTAIKCLAYWRPIIAGFLLLAAGAFMSLRKQPAKDQDDQQNTAQ